MECQWPPFAASAVVWDDKKAITRHMVAVASSRGKIGRIGLLRVLNTERVCLTARLATVRWDREQRAFYASFPCWRYCDVRWMTKGQGLMSAPALEPLHPANFGLSSPSC